MLANLSNASNPLPYKNTKRINLYTTAAALDGIVKYITIATSIGKRRKIRQE